MPTLPFFHPYSIGGGGFFERLDAWLRLPRGSEQAWRRRALLYVLIAYVPVLLIGLVLRLITGHWDPVLSHVELHVRSLVAAPLLLFAEHVVDARARDAGEYLLNSEIVRGDEVTAYIRIVERAERLRDSTFVDGLLFIIALASHLANVRIATLLHEAISVWGGFVAMTLFRFLLLRWLWRWGLWSMFLWRVSRMRLALSVVHPDGAGGLAEMAGPSEAFGIVAAAGSAALAGAWFDRMRDGVHLAVFYGPAAAYIVVMVAIGIMPVMAFTGLLYQLRRTGRCEYGALARRYCSAFQRKWFERSGDDALGAQDIQSLADLQTSYRTAAEMRVTACEPRVLATITAASIIPMLPLALAEVSAKELLLRVLKALA